MMRLDWVWLAATLVQALGLGIALAALGFAYERAVRERISLLAAVHQARLTGWLTWGGALLAGGMAFSEAGWLQKVAAIGLALCMAWIARRE